MNVDKFWSLVNKTDGCWLWTGGTAGRPTHRYGALTFNGRRHCKAHRVAYELVKGPIPDGQKVLHRCDVTLCVKPDDLFLGTQTDNMQDCAAKGRLNTINGLLAANAAHRAKTHCPHGHPYSGDNLKINKKGARICRVCANVKTLDFYHRNKAAINARRNNRELQHG